MNIILSLVIFVSSIFIYAGSTVAFAATHSSDYTDVYADLIKDESFDVRKYPALSVDEVKYSDTQATLEVIQIAESSSKELYLYVYQPLNKELFFTATSISMSCDYSSNGEGLNLRNYDLELVSTNDVFCKYVVKDFVVCDEVYRYYNIVCIRRHFDYTFDEKISGTEDGGNEKAVNVGQQWCFYYLNDELVSEMNTFDTLEIDVKYTGNFEFFDGLKWESLLGVSGSGQSWFICFDMEDYVATHIYDADLTYKTRSATKKVGVGAHDWEYDEDSVWSDDIKVTLTDKDEASYDGGGLLAKEYKWNRIMTSEDFIKNAESQDISISDEIKSKIKESQWTFSFCETQIRKESLQLQYIYRGTMVSDVTILRIHFQTIHGTYDLGVVSDRVNPDNVADGYGSGIDTDFFDEWFQKIGLVLGVVALLVILIFCGPIVTKILSLLIKGIWIIITIPFKLLGKIFNMIFNTKDKS